MGPKLSGPCREVVHLRGPCNGLVVVQTERSIYGSNPYVELVGSGGFTVVVHRIKICVLMFLMTLMYANHYSTFLSPSILTSKLTASG